MGKSLHVLQEGDETLYDVVILIGANVENGFGYVQAITDECQKKKEQDPNFQFLILGDGDAHLKEGECQNAMQEAIGPQTQIHILAHGEVSPQGVHITQLIGEEPRPTGEVLKFLSDIAEESTHIHQWTCYSGAVFKEKGMDMRSGSAYVAHSPPRHPTSLPKGVEGLRECVEHYQRGTGDFETFALSLTRPETATMGVVNAEGNEHHFTTRPHEFPITQIPEVTHLLNARFEHFKKWASEHGASPQELQKISHIQGAFCNDESKVRNYVSEQDKLFDLRKRRAETGPAPDHYMSRKFELRQRHFEASNGASQKGALLLQAAKDGYVDVVKTLLTQEGLDPSFAHGGMTALHLAAKHGHNDVVALLIEKGADPYLSSDPLIPSPYALSSIYGHTSIGQLMQERQPHSDPIMGSRVHYLARFDKVGLIQKCIEQGDNLNTQDADGFTPLMRAAQAHATGALKLLMDKGADITVRNHQNQTLWDMMLLERNTIGLNIVLAHVLEQGTQNSKSEGEVLLSVLESLQPESKPLFIDQLSDKQLGSWISYLNSKNDVHRVAQAFVGMNLEDRALERVASKACFLGFEHVGGYLLNNYPPLRENAALGISAVMGNQSSMIRLLEQCRYSWNNRSAQGETPLTVACKFRNKNLVDALLLLPSVDITAEGRDGKTPGYLAVETDNRELVATLRAKGFPVGIKTTAGSLLHAVRPHSSLFGELIEDPAIDLYAERIIEARPETASSVGIPEMRETVADRCAIIGNVGCLEQLVQKGYDFSRKNSMGDTPFQTALSRGNGEVISFFMNCLGPKAVPQLEAWLAKRVLTDPVPLSDSHVENLIFESIMQGRADVLEVMLRHNPALVNYEGHGVTPLALAVEQGNSDVLNQLLRVPGCDPNKQGAIEPDGELLSPLHRAVMKGDVVMVTSLLAHPDIDIGQKDQQGKTALAYVNDQPNAHQLKLLLSGQAKGKHTSFRAMMDQIRSDKSHGRGA